MGFGVMAHAVNVGAENVPTPTAYCYINSANTESVQCVCARFNSGEYIYMSTDDDLDSDPRNCQPNVRPYQQEQVLRNLYIGQDLTQQEIADHFNVVVGTINDWIKTYDIEKDRRSINSESSAIGYVNYYQGAEFIGCQHQIEALRSSHVTEVFADDTECHHKLGSPVKLDIACNLDVVEGDEHTADHADGTATVDPDELTPTLCEPDDDALSWNFSDGAPDHCLNSDDQDGDR